MVVEMTGGGTEIASTEWRREGRVTAVDSTVQVEGEGTETFEVRSEEGSTFSQ